MPKTFLSARWEDLIMANYAVDPQILQPYLPKGVELDFFEGKTYVSLVGFMFRNTRLFGVPIPLLGTFEEINLRFYVKRRTENGYKRGVVFINETVPYPAVAWLANKLYKEHYTAIPTKHQILTNAHNRSLSYQWKTNNNWNHLQLNCSPSAVAMRENSIEEFIFEHYYGYTKVSDTKTLEYRVNHPRWQVFPVMNYDISCDFKAMYGSDFEYLAEQKPDSVIVANGSNVTVDWKRHSI
ncbi:YqjF family protein [Flavobacterium aurantiibacter]|uniref:DUF2071 domain-containing protein n=1 Tax=Flavobacterium aurantiibacter TaxID=2023067 RepID=A0A255ZKN0_9FLAO|nr:DUF2071 domain-containing protein [Flavobacterium aurantiibacter]OYQ41962.1 hypothetical protein CHX27_12675 [Flavobacterium aurantiibacter]